MAGPFDAADDDPATGSTGGGIGGRTAKQPRRGIVAKQMVAVDYHRCQPEKCDGGVCLAVLACPQKVLRQSAAYEMPEPIAMCVGCGICAQACPCKAILMM